MASHLDDRLAALAAADDAPALNGLEDRVWAEVQARKAAAGAGSAGVRIVLTIASLALGLAFGVLQQTRPVHLSELGVLSEDGLLAPSIRLGGGA